MSELKQLAGELQAKERQWESEKVAWVAEIERLRVEVQLQKKILSANLKQSREGPEADGIARMHDSIRMQELQLENSQLKRDLGSLRNSVAEADSTAASKDLIEQFESLQTELERRREECIQLHTVLTDHARRMNATPGSSYGPYVNFLNEEGEFVLALEAQKKINRQLENELQAKEHQWECQKAEWMAIIERLREEIQLQKILMTNLSKSPQTHTEVNMQQNDVMRLTFENWRLREKYEKAAEDCKNANKLIEMLQSQLRETALFETADMKIGIIPTMTHLSLNEGRLMPEVIFKMEPKFEDMSEFHEEDINVNMHNFINADKSYVKLGIFSTTTHSLSNEGIIKKEPDFEDMSKFCEEDNDVMMHNLITVPRKADVEVDVFSTTTHSSFIKRIALMPETVCEKKGDFEGMFEFRKEDIKVIMHNLVTDLKPRVAITLLPGLPAYILFMCIRHTDYIHDDDKVSVFFRSFINTIKRVVRSRNDFEYDVLWLSNTLRLLHIMKQYSGDKSFQLENTPRQNEQCLRNFDLSEYRVILSHVSLWIFNNIINQLKERMQPFVVPALVEHKAIAGLTSRPRRAADDTANTSTDASLSLLLEHLVIVHRTLQYSGLEPQVTVQIFKQLFYFMCASALNNLLLRSELCHWSKGIQIRYNLSRLKQWAEGVQIAPAIDSLQPIIQAAQLLHTRKNDEDVDSICEMCNKLTGNQIIKILDIYTPANDYEPRVSVSFIRKVRDKLEERGEKSEGLLMNLKHAFPVHFPFSPSDIRFEDIEVPEVLNLPMLRKV